MHLDTHGVKATVRACYYYYINKHLISDPQKEFLKIDEKINFSITGSSLCLQKLPTIFKHCCEKLWLMKVASNAKFLGEFMWFPSSCGDSMAVSFTVSKSGKKRRYSSRCLVLTRIFRDPQIKKKKKKNTFHNTY